jgi:hypothetical protein
MHLTGDVGWAVYRTASGLWLDDYDTGSTWGPVVTIGDVFRLVEEFIAADTEALIRAIPVLEAVAL